MKPLTPEQMVQPKAIAPFEAAEAFAKWSAHWSVRGRSGDVQPVETIPTEAAVGPPWQLSHETHREFGERCALALFTLIKEI